MLKGIDDNKQEEAIVLYIGGGDTCTDVYISYEDVRKITKFLEENRPDLLKGGY